MKVNLTNALLMPCETFATAPGLRQCTAVSD